MIARSQLQVFLEEWLSHRWNVIKLCKALEHCYLARTDPLQSDLKAVNERSNSPELILASGSPRRSMLLRREGIRFAVIESRLHERRRPHEDASSFALRMATDKALAVSRRVPATLVLGADTVVECAGEILGKPKSGSDARRMLRTLSGRIHTVITAFVFARNGQIVEARAVPSRVTFRSLTEQEIEDYIASGEPFDKAGAYGIQHGGANFIAAVEGSRENVMGLPVEEVIRALARLGITPRPEQKGG
jgi:septum formation protein